MHTTGMDHRKPPLVRRRTLTALALVSLFGAMALPAPNAHSVPRVTLLTHAYSAQTTTMAARSKVRCRGTVRRAETKRACPHPPKVTGASVSHAPDSTVYIFDAHVRPRTRRWVDQVIEVEFTLGNFGYPTLTVHFGGPAGTHIVEPLFSPVPWHETEMRDVCLAGVHSGEYATNLTAVATTIAGLRSAPFTVPAQIPIRKWDLGGVADFFGIRTFMDCLDTGVTLE